jgi:hypothetical protein
MTRTGARGPQGREDRPNLRNLPFATLILPYYVQHVPYAPVCRDAAVAAPDP